MTSKAHSAERELSVSNAILKERNMSIMKLESRIKELEQKTNNAVKIIYRKYSKSFILLSSSLTCEIESDNTTTAILNTPYLKLRTD